MKLVFSQPINSQLITSITILTIKLTLEQRKQRLVLGLLILTQLITIHGTPKAVCKAL